MIINNMPLKSKESKEEILEFDLFDNFANTSKAQSMQELKNVSSTYNFKLNNGELKTGYGFKKLAMPTNNVDLDDEQELLLDGSQVNAVWSFKWYDSSKKAKRYYVVYFNELNHIGYADLFNTRPLTLYAPTTFTKTPVGNNTRFHDDDAMVFSSGEGCGFYLLTGSIANMYEDAPEIVSLCSQYDKYFAITAGERADLVYSDNDNLMEWKTSNTSRLKFNDDRGKLNKVIALNDYVYVFRDYGISKISQFSTKSDFDISGLYQCDSYIYPKTIASSGDNVYFLEGSGLFSFNGTKTSKINLECDEMLAKTDKRHASAVCFEGKYYLACRYDFNDDKTIGCENQPNYVNNILFVFDLVSKKIELMRGVDINTLCVLNNPYKSKVVACFNGSHKDKIGELNLSGEIFGENTEKEWQSVKCDLNAPEKVKKLKFLTIKTLNSVVLKVSSDKISKTYNIEGSDKIQRIRVDVFGREFNISFSTKEKQSNISNVKLGYSVQK